MHLRWAEEYIDWEVEQARALDAGVGSSDGVRSNARDLLHIRDPVCKLRYGLRDDDLVMETLQGIGLGILKRRAGRDADDGRAIRESCRQSRQSI